MLKTIKQHNDEMIKRLEEKENTKYNTGIDCPICGVELKYVDPYSVLLSYPPRKAVHCLKCGHCATIIVE